MDGVLVVVDQSERPGMCECLYTCCERAYLCCSSEWCCGFSESGSHHDYSQLLPAMPVYSISTCIHVVMSIIVHVI